MNHYDGLILIALLSLAIGAGITRHYARGALQGNRYQTPETVKTYSMIAKAIAGFDIVRGGWALNFDHKGIEILRLIRSAALISSVLSVIACVLLLWWFHRVYELSPFPDPELPDEAKPKMRHLWGMWLLGGFAISSFIFAFLGLVYGFILKD